MRNFLFHTLSFVLLGLFCHSCGDAELKNDPEFAKRAEELVAQMTLEEKVSQMMDVSPAIERLGIPAYNWWNEILHGVARTGEAVTVYPQAIANAAGFDREALQMMGDQAADEARAIYNKEVQEGNHGARYKGLTFWTPNINIFRDPRWGRGQETYGEDPYLTSELGYAIVMGLEGSDSKYLKVSACAKHFAVHSGPDILRHEIDVRVNNYDLWNTYLPAFERLVVDAQVSSVMCAYNRFDGKPCCGNDNLMINILRNRWDFDGYVVSDCGAVNDFWLYHKSSDDMQSAAVESVQSGTDLECGEYWENLWSYTSLEQAVADGALDVDLLDKSVARLFEIRMRLGMFDDWDDVPYNKISYDVVNSDAHKAHSLKMARQSMVLLKNNGILPLSKEQRSVAIVGPNSDDEVVVLGNYNGVPEDAVTAYEGLKDRFSASTNIVQTMGTDHITHIGLEAELSKIKDCDLVIFVGGISSHYEGEAGDAIAAAEGFADGDRTIINLPRVQTEFMKRVKDMGKQIILVNMSGSPMTMNWEDENIDAIIQAWYAGQSAGDAIADVIFGDYNPSGRLPFTIYKSVSDLPPFDDYSMSNRTYRYFTGEPLYEFGYGLSYTTFEYSNATLAVKGDQYAIDVEVSNVGDYSGDEIVELYIVPTVGRSDLALKSLKGFERVHIKAGQTQRVHFDLDKSAFAVRNDNGNLYYVDGEYSIYIGGCQPSAAALSEGRVVEMCVELK